MSDTTIPAATPTLRLSDADREAVADRIRAAAAEGRLTLEEADERQQAAYAAKVEADLTPLTADLPPPPAPGLRTLSPDARRRLMVHAGIGLAVVLLVLVRWIAGPVSFFWPGGPIFWIVVSIAAHYWFATRRRSAQRG